MRGSDLAGLVVLGLAAWRVTLLVTTDTITGRWRRWLLVRYPARTVPLYDVTGAPVEGSGRLKPRLVVELVNCDWCVGWWIAAAVVLVGRVVGLIGLSWPACGVAVWAVAAMVGALSDIVGR